MFKEKVNKTTWETISTSKTDPKNKEKVVVVLKNSQEQEKKDAQKKIPCFQCHKRGHYKHHCPYSRSFTAREWMDITSSLNKRVMIVLEDDGTLDILRLLLHQMQKKECIEQIVWES